MRSDYHLQDLVFQDSDRVVYRAHGKDGSAHAIVRLKLPPETLPVLAEGCFDRALQELTALEHLCLRPVVDGGLDPVDGYPWVAVRWWPGPHLNDRIDAAPLSDTGIDLLEENANSLIEYLGVRAGAISFDPSEIVNTESLQGKPVETFVINYWTWFNDRAESRSPGTGKSAPRALRKLVKSLRPVEEPAAATPPTARMVVQPAIPREPVITPPPKTITPPKTPVTSVKTSLLAPIITVITLLALVSGGVWLALERRAQIIAEEQEKARGRTPSQKAHPEETADSPDEKFYTVAQEAELRAMAGEAVTLKAKIAGYSQSEDGKTHFLIIHNDGPGFRAGVRKNDSEEGLDQSYLQQFVGETMMISGQVATLKHLPGTEPPLLILFNRKAHLQRIQE
jgi:hypothetical protein